jgi:urease accessory protein
MVNRKEPCMLRTVCAFSLLILASGGALAHPNHAGAGLAAGLAHPFLGADHLLAMLAVGFWAARFGGGARWALPAAFVTAMFAGALLGLNGFAWAGDEAMIAASVLALGLLVASSMRLQAAAGAALIAGFALFHGHAHFAELPAGAAFASFAAGMLLATAVLHVAGIGLALGLGRFGAWLPRAFGAATALAGAWFLVA